MRENCSFFFPRSVRQPLRDELRVRVAAVHLRVDGGRAGALQHQGDDEGGRQRAAGRHTSLARLRHRHHAQPGHQGGKSRGVYLKKKKRKKMEGGQDKNFRTPIFFVLLGQVFDDICTELAMAVLQFFQSDGLPEEHVFRCLKALAKFSTIAHRDVPQLVRMIGPDPSKFSGTSARCDDLIQAISARIAATPTLQ